MKNDLLHCYFHSFENELPNKQIRAHISLCIDLAKSHQGHRNNTTMNSSIFHALIFSLSLFLLRSRSFFFVLQSQTTFVQMFTHNYVNTFSIHCVSFTRRFIILFLSFVSCCSLHFRLNGQWSSIEPFQIQKNVNKVIHV